MMYLMPRLLLVTTDQDYSAELFQAPESSRLIESSIILYNAPDSHVPGKAFEFIYFRDPFNDTRVDQAAVRRLVEKIYNQQKDAYFTDGITSYDDMLIEDKWEQYQLLKSYMPETKLLDSINSVNFNGYFLKKRISSRSRDIVFSKEDFPADATPNEYIIQAKLDVHTEYRVFIIGGKIVKPLVIKSSKSKGQKVKVVGTESHIDEQIKAISDAVYQATKFDFIGIDIAKAGNEFWLIELNRSCQFKGFYRESSMNLAAIFNSYLLSRRA